MNLTDLIHDVSKATSVIEATTILVTGIAQRVAETGTDAEKLHGLVTALFADKESLSDAVVANTPGGPVVDADAA